MGAELAAEAGTLPSRVPARPVDGRPNIILMIGDDHGYPYFGFTGHPTVQTPNLNALAESGTLFTRVHTTASTCPPSLNTLLTGLYPTQFQSRMKQLRRTGHAGLRKHRASAFVETLPRVLAQRGYVSFQAGKFWDGSATQAGFTDGTVTELEASHHGGDATFGRDSIEPALRFIDSNLDRPFFLWFAPMLPHTPFNAPERYRASYVDAKISATAKSYYANCTWFDDLVGQLLRHLEERRLSENTLVVYISDNGWDQPEKGLGPGDKGKDTMHEQGFRTPLIFRWPGRVPAGRVFDRFVSAVDVFPTLLSFAGATEVPPGRLGIDLRPLIEGGDAPIRNELVGRMHRKVKRAAIDSYYLTNGRWHYIWNALDDEEELFDKKRDPEEQVNVRDSHPEVARELRERIKSWEREAVAAFGRDKD